MNNRMRHSLAVKKFAQSSLKKKLKNEPKQRGAPPASFEGFCNHIRNDRHTQILLAELVMLYRVHIWRKSLPVSHQEIIKNDLFNREGQQLIETVYGRSLGVSQQIQCRKMLAHLFERLISNKQYNDIWGLNCFILFYRRSRFHYILHCSPFTSTDRRVHTILRKKLSIMPKSMQQVLKDVNDFYKHMSLPFRNAEVTECRQDLSLLAVCSLIMLAVIVEWSSYYHFMGGLIIRGEWLSLAVVLLLLPPLLCFVAYVLNDFEAICNNILEYHFNTHSPFSYSPFYFNNLDQSLRTGLLGEIKQALSPVVAEISPEEDSEESDTDTQQADKKETQQNAQLSAITASKQPQSLSVEEKRKPKKKSNLPHLAQFYGEQSVPLSLEWKIGQHIIKTDIGVPKIDVFQLWSALSNLHATCQYYFLYFSLTDPFFRKEDKQVVSDLFNTAQYGRVVSHEGHAGVIKVTEPQHAQVHPKLTAGQSKPVDHFKIKPLKSPYRLYFKSTAATTVAGTSAPRYVLLTPCCIVMQH